MKRTIVAVTGLLLVLGCSATPSTPMPTATAPVVTSAPLVTSTPVVKPTPGTTAPTVSVAWPPGGEVPQALSGLWYEASHPSTITLQGNDYTVVQPGAGARGNVVVNGDEIDFFNGNLCGLRLPRGVGKYRWELVGDSAVKFTGLNEDPCPRVDILAGVTWTRTPASPAPSQ